MNKKILIIASAVTALLVSGLVVVQIKKGKVRSVAKKSASPSYAFLLSQAKDLEANGSLLESKNAYQKLVSDFPGSAEIVNWQKKTEDINIKLLFSPVITPKSAVYEIKPGDTLTKISKEFKTTTDLIKKSNNLSSDNISPGKKIKVWTAPFAILVDKSQNILYLKCNEEIIKTYIVSTGRNNCSPVGTFRITNKLINPTWFKKGQSGPIPAGSPENILGTRWLGFDLPEYGIHGTTDPQSLGKQATSGCVRMANSDVEEVYTIIPVGTEVIIVD